MAEGVSGPPPGDGPVIRQVFRGARVTRGSATRMLGWFVAAALAGCSESGPRPRAGSAPPRTPDVESAVRARTGRTWELERLGEQDVAAPTGASRAGSGEQPSRPRSRPTIRFTADSVPVGSV